MMRGFFVLLVLALAGSHCAVVWAQEYTPQCRNAGTGKLQDCTGRLRRDQAPLVDVQRFTVVGAALWTKPVGSYQLCTTRCCGGGGGGGSDGGNGLAPALGGTGNGGAGNPGAVAIGDFPGGGGSGGGGSNAGLGGSGGAGGRSAGGGGGGHAALGSNSGAGGAGGPGFVIVWCQ